MQLMRVSRVRMSHLGSIVVRGGLDLVKNLTWGGALAGLGASAVALSGRVAFCDPHWGGVMD